MADKGSEEKRSAETPHCGRKDSVSFPPPAADPNAPSVLITSHKYIRIRCQQYSVVLSNLNCIHLVIWPDCVNLKEVFKWASSCYIALEINVRTNKDSPNNSFRSVA